jgi:hypothetical protein
MRIREDFFDNGNKNCKTISKMRQENDKAIQLLKSACGVLVQQLGMMSKTAK